MAEAAHLPLPFPEALVVEEPTLGEQTLAIAAALPERPLVLGGCCCAHAGAVVGLSGRYDRLGVVWFDAHGDLNTPRTSPSGNAWGMPLRRLLDSGAAAVEDTALVGARSLDAPEEEFIASSGLPLGEDGIERALEGVDGVYVAFDCDVLEPGEAASFMPEPGGLSLADAERLLTAVRRRADVVGAGFSGLRPEPENVEPLVRLAAALGL
jgi:arginase